MSRVETIGDATLILGDCLEVMPTLEPVDHIIRDPPYEQMMHDLHASTRLRRVDGGSERRDLTFEGINEMRPAFVTEVERLNQGWFLAFCNVEGVWHWRDAICQTGMKFKTTIAWIKPDCTPKLNGQGPALGYECCTTTWAGKGYSKWNAGGKRGVYTHCANGPNRNGQHPAEKPVTLMAELITDFTNAGQTVLDPFMGSGTTGVAALKLGRKFIGIEKNPAYFDLACKRIAASLSGARGFARFNADERQADIFGDAA